MDTDAYMTNQMDDMITGGIKLHENLIKDAEETYQKCPIFPSVLLELLQNIESHCNPENPEHEIFWRISWEAIKHVKKDDNN